MRTSGFTANSFKILLITLLVGSISAGTAGFIYSQHFLKSYAIEVSHKQKDAQASNSALNMLGVTKKELEENADIRKKIGNLRATSQFPEFLVVSEVQKIADNNNVKIKTFSYGSATTGQLPGQPTTGTPTPGATPTPTNSTALGKTITLLVELENPVDQKAFLQFINDIEQHLPKMRLNGLSVTPAETTDKINTAQLTIELYLA